MPIGEVNGLEPGAITSQVYSTGMPDTLIPEKSGRLKFHYQVMGCMPVPRAITSEVLRTGIPSKQTQGWDRIITASSVEGSSSYPWDPGGQLM